MRCLVTRRASWTEIISAKPNTGWRKRETCRPRRCRESRWSFSILASMRLLMSLRSQALEDRDRVLAHDGGAELRDYRDVLSEGGVVLFCQCVDRLQRVVDRQGNDRRRAWSRSERDDVSLLHGPRDSRNDRRPVSGVTSGAVGRDLDDFGVRVRCQAAPDLSRDRSANISHINPRPKKPPPKRKGNKQTVHVSTKRILDKRK